MKTTTIKIRGLTPLLMHNGQLADPLNEHALSLSKLSKKRQKTIDDHKALSKLPKPTPHARSTPLPPGVKVGGVKVIGEH